MKQKFKAAGLLLLLLAVVLALSSCAAQEAPVLTVSEDGYWEIDGEKTHLPATGEAGSSPELSVDGSGYWTVNGVSTDKRAIQYEEFVGFNLWTTLFAWCNLLLLYLLLRHLLFRPVKNMIDKRQAEIDGMYAEAETARSDAGQLRAEYEGKLEKVKEESEELLRRTVRKAQLREEEILHEADEKAARALRRAEEQAELEKKRAIHEAKNEVSGMAIDIAAAVIGRDVDAKEHGALIDDFIAQIGE